MAEQASSQAPLNRRVPLIDVLRGVALAAMAVYHFAWDLSFFSLAEFGVTENPLWIAFARAIAGSFLALVGVGLYLAHGDGAKWKPFLRRLAMIAAAALAISIASIVADPDGVILFGILHCIAVSSVIGLLFLRAPLALVIAAAIACLVAPSFLTSPAFNDLGWVWLGLGSEVRPSNDYNPLLPWFGMVLAGIAIARIIPRDKWPRWQPHDVVTRMLALIGRHSLLFYLLHQPVLLGTLWAVAKAIG
ncbi:MAG TPA: heparan-alpha-glucosaminide N-acetyltransferase [Pseudorhodoplanes sp.]|nr:heparan-alpha-glucosaminide N-acetyltransferase [Pseudorhodoplanes sp.]